MFLQDFDVVQAEFVMDSEDVAHEEEVREETKMVQTSRLLQEPISSSQPSKTHASGTKSVATQVSQRSGCLSVESLKGKPQRVLYYRGLENFVKLMLVYHSLGPSASI